MSGFFEMRVSVEVDYFCIIVFHKNIFRRFFLSISKDNFFIVSPLIIKY